MQVHAASIILERSGGPRQYNDAGPIIRYNYSYYHSTEQHAVPHPELTFHLSSFSYRLVTARITATNDEGHEMQQYREEMQTPHGCDWRSQ